MHSMVIVLVKHDWKMFAWKTHHLHALIILAEIVLNNYKLAYEDILL